ncbi:MAG TPA: PH domain-containing protein [Acidimicrobiales bacterium]|nr:PH domain-containing protein [Acidimicrobiales bacterium]
MTPSEPGSTTPPPSVPPPPPPPTVPPPPPPPTRRPGWRDPGRTHPLSPWLGLRAVVGELLPWVFAAVAIGRVELVPLVIVVVAGSRLARWARRTWSFDGEVVTLDDGVVRRTRRRVPVTRMQQVSVEEPLLHRMAGLAVVRIETAGGAGRAEVELDALPRHDAADLRAALLTARAEIARAEVTRAEVERAPATGGATGPEPDGGADAATVPAFATTAPADPPPWAPTAVAEEPVLRLSVGRLAVAGVSGANLLVALAVIGAAFDALTRLPREVVTEVGDSADAVVGALGVALVAVVAVVAMLVLAAGASVVAHHDLTVVRRGDELHLRRGLLDRRETVVPLHRVKSVVVAENPLHRLLGLAAVRVRSAGGGAGDDERVLVPLADSAEIDRLVQVALGRPVALDGLDGAPPAARRRRLARRLGPLAVVVVALGVVAGWSPPLIGVALVAAVVATASGLDAYRALGVRLDDDVVVVRRGSLVRRTTVAVRHRVQSGRTSASVFQRRAGLATAHADLAGGAAAVVLDQSVARCDELVDHLTGARAALGARRPM